MKKKRATEKVPPELEEFVQAFADMLVADFDKRRAELRQYLRTQREWIDNCRFTDDRAVNHEVTLRIQKLKQLLNRLEKRFYTVSKSDTEQVTLREQIQHWQSDIEKLLGAYPVLKRDQKMREQQRDRAKKPRKEKPTKEELLRYRDEFEHAEGKQRGWIAAACRKFGIDRGTLNKIIRD